MPRITSLRPSILAAIAVAALVAGCTTGASPSASAGVNAAPSAGESAPAASGKPDKPDRLKPPKLDRGLGHGGRGGVAGPITITAISGSSVSLKTADGWTRTITVTADTKITKGGADIAVADLEVGDTIRLGQKRNDDGTFTVTAIAVVVPVIAGSVESVGETTLTLKVRGGTTRTVTLTSTTTYQRGDADATKADVHAESVVVISGEEGTGGSFTAITVRIKPDQTAGEVTAKTADSLTLKRRDGTSVTVHVGSSTKYFVRGADSPSLTDIVVGARVGASGTRNADGSLNADVVAAGKVKSHDKASPAPSPSA